MYLSDFQNFDPYFSNGILPLPMDLMLSDNINYNENLNKVSKDCFVSENKIQEYPAVKKWKKYAFATLITVLGFAGLSKLGFNPISKITNSKFFINCKNFITNKFKKTP